VRNCYLLAARHVTSDSTGASLAVVPFTWKTLVQAQMRPNTLLVDFRKDDNAPPLFPSSAVTCAIDHAKVLLRTLAQPIHTPILKHQQLPGQHVDNTVEATTTPFFQSSEIKTLKLAGFDERWASGVWNVENGSLTFTTLKLSICSLDKSQVIKLVAGSKCLICFTDAISDSDDGYDWSETDAGTIRGSSLGTLGLCYSPNDVLMSILGIGCTIDAY